MLWIATHRLSRRIVFYKYSIWILLEGGPGRRDKIIWARITYPKESWELRAKQVFYALWFYNLQEFISGAQYRIQDLF